MSILPVLIQGIEYVNIGGTANTPTTVNGGRLELSGASAKATNLNSGATTEVDAFNGSQLQGTFIRGGRLLVDQTSTLTRQDLGKFAVDFQGPAILGLENPKDLKAPLKDMQIGDVIKLGGLGIEPSPGVTVTNAPNGILTAKNGVLNITYTYGSLTDQKVSYALQGSASNKFQVVTAKDTFGDNFSTLTMVSPSNGPAPSDLTDPPSGPNVALLTQHMASAFVSPSIDQGVTPIADPAPPQHSLLSLPHA